MVYPAFSLAIGSDQECAGDTDRKTGDVDDGMPAAAGDVADGSFVVGGEHGKGIGSFSAVKKMPKSQWIDDQ
jgi:hypothetical protein